MAETEPQPRQGSRVLVSSGWLTNDQAKIAHYFDQGRSACHFWMSTTRDRPAPAGVRRCTLCKEAVSRAF